VNVNLQTIYSTYQPVIETSTAPEREINKYTTQDILNASITGCVGKKTRALDVSKNILA
jgi:hypothetical protein